MLNNTNNTPIANNVAASFAVLSPYQLSAEDLQEEPVFLIDDFLVKQSISMFFAAGGSGKSFLTLSMSLKLLKEKRVKTVLYMDMDNSLVALKKRGLDKIIEDTPELYYIHTSRLKGDPFDLIGQLVAEAKKDSNAFKDTLIVFDSIRDFIAGRDMNSDREITPVMQMLKTLRESGATVIFLHHTTKESGGKTYRGSSSFRDSVDIAYALSSQRQNNTLTFTLELDKDRLGVGELIAFSLDTQTMVLEDTNTTTASMDETELMRVKMLTKVINDNPEGIGQSELLKAVGKGSADRTSMKMLQDHIGKLWDMKKGGKNNTSLYFPLQNLQNLQKSA